MLGRLLSRSAKADDHPPARFPPGSRPDQDPTAPPTPHACPTLPGGTLIPKRRRSPLHLRRIATASATLLAALALTAGRAEAHQPFFEDTDYTAEQPRLIQDPLVSTANYATLDRPDDIDYYRFAGQAGQEILIRVDIPRIAAQKDFAPTVALTGPDGAQILEPPDGDPPTFYEPFTRTAYWTRQSKRVKLPADGDYWLVVYSPRGATGHYTLSVGEQEAFGGDLLFPVKIRRYFKPLPDKTDSKASETTTGS